MIKENQLHRFVQYESCRGLEAWITFLLGLDRFHEQKQSWYRAMRPDLSQAEVEKQPQIYADEWLIILLTRCISTLGIQLASHDSPLSKILLQVADNHRDHVEVQDRETRAELRSGR